MTVDGETDETLGAFIQSLVAHMSDADRAAMLYWAQDLQEIK
jgi:hypothetical protein